MRALYKLFRHKCLSSACLALVVSLQSPLTLADVLVWASDIRSGAAVNAESSEWMRFLQSESAGTATAVTTPTALGVADQYPLHLVAQPDVGALMTSRLASGSEAAVWIQLSNSGLQWFMERNGEAQQLSTPASSEGLALGLNWIGVQLSMVPTSPALTAPSTAAPSVNPSSAPATTNYQHPGQTLLVTGVFDAADFLRLTQGVRQLEGVDYVFPSQIDGTDVELVIGAQMAPMQLQALLAQQPWLRRTEQGELRWDALAMPLSPQALSSAQTQQSAQTEAQAQ